MAKDGYKGHAAGSNVEKLHKAFDSKGREAALKVGAALGYSQGGASSWISYWLAQDKKAKKSGSKNAKKSKSKSAPATA